VPDPISRSTHFPLPFPGLRAVAVGLWLANIALFALFSLLYIARWLLFPREGKHEIRDSEPANCRHRGVRLPKSARDADG
jgi:Voltage-dependent anion channel